MTLPPIDDEEMSADDRAMNRGWSMNQPLYGKGPRRLRGDRNPNGKYVWVAEYFGGRLAKIDIRTKQLTEYKLPGPYRFGYPYEPVIDKNGIVWLGMANADVLTRFDPTTDKFTLLSVADARPQRPTHRRGQQAHHPGSVGALRCGREGGPRAVPNERRALNRSWDAREAVLRGIPGDRWRAGNVSLLRLSMC